MVLSGPFFYDDPQVFSNYMSRRNSETSANDTLEKPILMELLPPLENKDILDLGCGEATLAAELLKAGAQSYLGLDGSANMVKLAQQELSGKKARVEQAFLENWDYPTESFDCVISRLAFHYIEDIEALFAKIQTTLRKGGHFVFSVEHPVITSHQISMKEGGARQDWLVDRYFHTGKREYPWLGAPILKYHRTVEDYYQALRKSGFQILDLRESKPRPELFQNRKLYERRMRVPLFLLLKAEKP
ncbi:SAM-dependent methyltransferase [bacterium (Candidatus Blackallbacteria) CG17_big_fil_post_rev_8_21_14_2_50_48_46]|uniref:SAM-dependent methyltransferase n=1 Tax=bacterium (Candidatus Blackallbacteria) CG17_big_fil_post_rev_8_21_14_2_50_48_46 TaxID=2014261 RepID=A0A2M7G3L3_9BACT|nr:MAG: SAM-dependent methyltransferase [bacterium (Candidatus Blackallbacteria) CG18_big_fil_WC_8_21_14_2_50_49_26]PIW16377.1 MAG: SAM-dependent methyltransferase [bacterium (Candidatus Blackallbacteria) CG17_big_fil_post_rev_8_21_14_2_50_48_46]PIW45390.1 MAG: SAM-dependent methyltransferase [bacterium (Candidatus Blackallbacteria) CG13_big_fil_rev_8_21_14_2_50_49_14]